MGGPEHLALELLDGVSQLLHVVVINIGQLIGHGNSLLGRGGNKLPAWLTCDLDGVVVVVVPDLCLRPMEGLTNHVFRHVNPGGECVPRLDRILTIPPDSGPRVPEQELLEPP